tara:strand:+ start:396 stop:629 length:234 start_codon:yes stop_codon:yes gene_type:complete
MANYEQTELDLHIKKTKEQQQSSAADSLKIHDEYPMQTPIEELRSKARLYSRGGGIHYGIPPEERSSTRWWNDATNQ